MSKRAKTDDTHSPAEYALMGLLREGPCHGYRLAAAFAPEGRLALILRLKIGQMYAYLHKLERQGWLHAAVEPSGDSGSRARKMFALTPDGEAAFDRWLAAPVATTRDIRLDFLLKLAFTPNPDAAAQLIQRQRAVVAGRLERLRARAASAAADTATPLSRLVLDLRTGQSEAALAWLDEAHQRLANTVEPEHHGTPSRVEN